MTTQLIASDHLDPSLGSMLEGYDSPAILVTPDYQILATNQLYQNQFGDAAMRGGQRCFEVSHGYQVPCDQAGEDCPLLTAKSTGHKARVLHIHQTPRGPEHVDVELLPIKDRTGNLLCFVELLKSVPTAGVDQRSQKMVGKSPAFNRMLEKITRVSDSQASVLLLGESGTGKELAAAAIHQGSSRRAKPMVTLECAGLTDSLFESELFGHVKGAFTGASVTRKGLVEHATGGTLFLDEIGDVPLSMQVKLLRLLETGTYRAVGAATTKTSDFRLICATHKNLQSMIDQGQFRQDLYYRIAVFPIHVPALREREPDLPLIVHALLQRLSPEQDFHLTESAFRALRAHSFPGNVRELRNIINRALLLADTNVIDADVIGECLSIDTANPPPPSPQARATPAVNRDNCEDEVDLKTMELRYLKQLMDAHDQDRVQVARIAGISVRSLYRKLQTP